MLIAISSSQGAGKSTLITRLTAMGYDSVTRKTSRSILTDWNVRLEDVNADTELTIKFQNEILKRKISDDTIASENATQPVFSERSFIDLWTYSLIALGSTNSCSDWLDDYYRQCIAAQQIYDKVYYLTAGHFKPEHDGVRGSNRHYSRMVDITMAEYFQQMTIPTKQCIINTPNFEDRIAIITSHNPLYESS